jgi:hypothetical protein
MNDHKGASNRRIGLLVFAVMVCAAGIGLAYALMTVSDRRAGDPPRIEQKQP